MFAEKLMETESQEANSGSQSQGHQEEQEDRSQVLDRLL